MPFRCSADPASIDKNPEGRAGASNKVSKVNWALPTRTFQQALFGRSNGTEMNGGTTFHFVTDGIHPALDRARQAANGKDIRIGGGVAVVRQYLHAGLIDDAHFAITPALLGSGEHVFGGMNLPALGYDIVEHAASESALHVVLRKGGPRA